MTSRTTLEHRSTLNFVFGLPHQALLQLLGVFVFAPPLHVEDLALVPQKTFRLAMTLETPLHLQRRRRERDRHFINAAVTRRTTDTFVHVNTVIKVSVVGQIVNANPLDGFARAKTRAHRFEIWTVGPDLFVTTHARVG